MVQSKIKDIFAYLKQHQLIFIIISTFFAYVNIFQNDFVIDDQGLILDWPTIRNFNNLPALLLGELPPNFQGKYRPLRSVLHLIYYHIFGDNPFGYHLHSLVVHIISTIIIFFIIKEIFERLQKRTSITPFAASLLFGLHPIHVESITYISASLDSTGILFFFTAFLFYLKSLKHTKFLPYSLVFSALAFFTNEITLTLPLIIVLYDITLGKIPISDISKRLRIYASYLIIAFLFIFSRTFIARVGLLNGDYMAHSFVHTMIMMPVIFVRYIYMFLLPTGLSYVHTLAPGFESYMNPHSNFQSILSKTFLDFDVLFSIIFLLGLASLAIYFYKKFTIFSFSVGFFFISLLPVSYIVPAGPGLSERYLYIPSLGFVLLLAYLIDYLSKKVKIGFVLTLLFLIASLYGIKTHLRNKDWKNTESLWQSVIRVYPNSLLGHFNLSNAYTQNNKLELAIQESFAILKSTPNFWEIHFNIANNYYRLGKLIEAEEELKKTFSLSPDFLDAYILQGQIYLQRQKFDQAITQLQRGLNTDISNYEVLGKKKTQEETMAKLARIHFLLGQAYEAKNSLGLASQSYTEALRLTPDFFDSGIWKSYSTGQGILLSYPQSWQVKDLGEKIVFDVIASGFRVELRLLQILSSSTPDQFLSTQSQLGTLVNQGPAQIPNFDSAYLKIWETDQRTTIYQFFLFKGKKSLEIVVSPVNTTFDKKNFDMFVSSIQVR